MTAQFIVMVKQNGRTNYQMKYFYVVAQTLFIAFAIANLIQGNVLNYDFLILSFLMAILGKLEAKP